MTSVSDRLIGAALALAVGLGAFALAACGDSSPLPTGSGQRDSFTADAAAAAYNNWIDSSTDPDAYCGFLLPYAEKQIIGVAKREGADVDSCRALYELESGPTKDRDGVEPVAAGDATLDAKMRTAAFLDEFRSGPVLKLVGGQWRLRGFATGG